ncbi:hypothetical protein ACV35N_34040, partial [Pseudomonas aeruginosa]
YSKSAITFLSGAQPLHYIYSSHQQIPCDFLLTIPVTPNMLTGEDSHHLDHAKILRRDKTSKTKGIKSLLTTSAYL